MMMMCQGFQMILWYDVFRCIQMYSVIRIINVIKLGSGIRVIADCRLPPALLDQNWFVERVIWKVLLLHNKILINQDFMYLEGAHQGTQFSNAPPDLISLVLFMNRDVIGQVCPFFEESGNIIGTVDCQNLLVAMNVQRDCLKLRFNISSHTITSTLSFRYVLILSAAPVASILASDMLSNKFTKNWQYTPQNWIMATISGPKRNNLKNQFFEQL